MSSAGGGFRSGFDRDALTSLTGMMMIAAVVVLFVAVLFVVFLHLFARRARRRSAEVGDPAAAAAPPRKWLDAAIVRALPVLVFQASQFKEGLECSVCLCELSDGEKARLLPNCNHGFHLDCIDMWFQSHSTCPLCRDVVAPASAPPRSGDPPAMEVLSLEPLSFPTNVLFWGNEGEVVNARVTRLEEGSSSSSSTGGEGEVGNGSSGEQDNMKTTATRFRSLKRLLSRDRRVVAPCGSSGGDVEQGFDGSGLNQ